MANAGAGMSCVCLGEHQDREQLVVAGLLAEMDLLKAVTHSLDLFCRVCLCTTRKAGHHRCEGVVRHCSKHARVARIDGPRLFTRKICCERMSRMKLYNPVVME